MALNVKTAEMQPSPAVGKGVYQPMTQEQHRATARVLDIFEALSASKQGLTLTELSQALDAPKSSLFPIVHTMEERHYLQQHQGTGRYTMGPGVLTLGAAFAADEGRASIVQVMKDVVETCQETCQLGILDQGNVLYIEKQDSTQAIRMISWVGNRLPATATAIGKALLSGLTDSQVRALYQNGLSRLTGDIACPTGRNTRWCPCYGVGGVHRSTGLLGCAPAAAGEGICRPQHLCAAFSLQDRENPAGGQLSPRGTGENRRVSRNQKFPLV